MTNGQLREVRKELQCIKTKVCNLETGEGGGGIIFNDLPTMTKAALSSYGGSVVNLVNLSDGGATYLAVYNIHDTTSLASATIIVDSLGRRYYLESLGSLLDGYLNNYSPFP